MNTCVQAGPITLCLVARLGKVRVSTTISFVDNFHSVVELTCLPLTKLTVNGHSISAINPELVLTGGTTTLEMA